MLMMCGGGWRVVVDWKVLCAAVLCLVLCLVASAATGAGATTTKGHGGVDGLLPSEPACRDAFDALRHLQHGWRVRPASATIDDEGAGSDEGTASTTISALERVVHSSCSRTAEHGYNDSDNHDYTDDHSSRERREVAEPATDNPSTLPGSTVTSPRPTTFDPWPIFPPGLLPPCDPNQLPVVPAATPPPEPRASAGNVLCTLSSIIQTRGCDLPTGTVPGTASLTVIFDPPSRDGFKDRESHGDLVIGEVTNLTNALLPRTVVFEGKVTPDDLEWVISAGNWSNTESVGIHGLLDSTFVISTLEPFERLVDLDLSSNRLTSLFTSPPLNLSRPFPPAAQIQSLVLNHNLLLRVPTSAVRRMPLLHTLRITHNQITLLKSNDLAMLSRLAQLDLDRNFISTIEADAFEHTPALVRLTLSNNLVTHLNPALLGTALSGLRILHLGSNAFEGVEEDAFANVPGLIILDLDNCNLEHLPPALFRPTSELWKLNLHDNSIKALPHGVFDAQTRLTHLSLDSNDLTELHPDTLLHVTRLRTLILSKNKLSSLPRHIFNSTQRLGSLHLASNRLTSFEEAHVGSLPTLSRLVLRSNQLSSFHTSASRLLALDIGDNLLVSMPRLGELALLTTLHMSGHRILEVDVTDLLAEGTIITLTAAAAPGVHGARVLVDLEAAKQAPTLRLKQLDLKNMEVPEELFSLLALKGVRLDRLEVGWPGMNEDTVEFGAMCFVLASSLLQLSITDTSYRSIATCHGIDITTLSLQENTALGAVTIPSNVQQLNVSGCTRLYYISVSGSDVLDISRTRVPFMPQLCQSHGTSMLLARDLLSPSFRDPAAVISLLRTCLPRVGVLDLSNNAWLASPSLVHAAQDSPTLISGDVFLMENQRMPFMSRREVVTFNADGTPIGCKVSLRNVRAFPPPAHRETVQLAYMLTCSCQTRFRLDGGRCVPDVLTKEQVAGIAVGTLLAGIAIAFGAVAGYRWYHSSKKLRYMLVSENELQKRLIEEKDEEVLALKKVWEIGHEELAFVKRIDAGSEGAFGEVWLARWDTVTVAVKVLRQSMMLFDETTVEEFEKEVEFLRTCRHPHVVRFFGAGTDSSGSPFLVLEYVALGSLKALLQRGDVAPVLEHARAQEEEQVLNTSGGASGRCGVSRVPQSVWELKVRLARDIAAGMAFIHGLGHIHRDLKSANVLVSNALRAKIADFGSIRQCLLNSTTSTIATNASMSNTGTAAIGTDHDMDYGAGLGGQTVHLTMTAGVGTPLYMAPEVLLGGQYDAAADVFSFGVLLWEVAMQRPPDLIAQEKGGTFRGPLFVTLSDLLQDGKRLRFDEAASDCPTWVTELSQQCMDGDPAARPSFSAIEETFSQYLLG